MRIFLIIILSCILGLSSLHAQIQTFDIKRNPSGEEPGGYGDFQQISPTRILASAGNYNEQPYLLALNRDGTIAHQWRTPFLVNPSSTFYRFDQQSNTVVYLTTELISGTPPLNLRLRLVLLDSNLSMKSNVILDSTMTGMQTVFGENTTFRGITLLDSSILLMSYRYTKTKMKQVAIHLSKDGHVISNNSILDTNNYITHYPLFQLSSGKILYESATFHPETNRYIISFRTSDTSFHFTTKPILDSLYNGSDKKYISTRDSGIALTYYDGIFEALVVKYDKNFQKQWAATVPGNGGHKALTLIESRNGGYYIATTAVDTLPIHNYPKFKDTFPWCFEDIVLSKIDTSGKVLFSANYGTELCKERFDDMMEDYIDGGIIIGGGYNLSTPLGGCDETNAACGSNPFTIWLFKVDTLGQPAKRITGVNEYPASISDILLFPNPASGKLTVEFGKTDYFTTVEITDNYGNILKQLPLEFTLQRINIDISSLTSGNYYCRLQSRSHSITRPFIIQR